jgi:hypothetical protein
VGPIAAGEAVIADNAGRIATHLKQLYGDALAVEMEGCGFLEAAHVDSGCRAVVVRGISDRLTGKVTSDRRGWQQRAADSAATFFFEMLALEAGSAQPNQAYSKPAVQSSGNEPTLFPNAQPKDGPARFRAPGDAIGFRDGAGFLDANAGNSISLAPGPAMWLRLMPSVDPGRKWASYELVNALNRGVNLQPMIWPNLFSLRAEDGVGTCALLTSEAHETNSIAFAFETGEVWAIDTCLMGTEPAELFPVEIERMLTGRLPEYGHFLALLGLQPPYQWIAGVTGVKNRRLQYPSPQGQMRVPGWSSPRCVAEHIISDGTYDGKQSPTSALLPFFKEIYDKYGMPRPEYLPQ